MAKNPGCRLCQHYESISSDWGFYDCCHAEPAEVYHYATGTRDKCADPSKRNATGSCKLWSPRRSWWQRLWGLP